MSRRWLVGISVIALLLLGWLAYRVWWVFPRADPLAVGSTAPDFELEDSSGARHALSGPALVVFYRGHW